jgi:hypothetical protein
MNKKTETSKQNKELVDLLKIAGDINKKTKTVKTKKVKLKRDPAFRNF